MKRFLCPSHAHRLKPKARPVQLSTEECSICKWEKRPYTLLDIARELEDIAVSMRVAHESPDYDPFGYSYAYPFQALILEWFRMMHEDYRKTYINEINKLLEDIK